MANRHLSRSIVLQALFEWDFGGKNFKDAEDIFLRDADEFGAGHGDFVFMETLLKGVLSKQKDIDLIIEKAKIKTNTIAVNPFSASEIYYATDTTFYRSLDGGKNWTSKKLPTSRAGFKLLIDPKSPSIIYLAVKQVKKK